MGNITRQRENRCVIIGAAPNPGPIPPQLQPDDFVICADGGLDFALAWDICPQLAVGDYDSLQNPGLLAKTEHVTLPREKDDTDTMAAVKIGLERGFRRFLLLNCTGGRLDHTFANLTVLMYLQQHGATGLLRDGNCTAQVCGEGHIPLKQRKGDGLSLFPFGCPEVTVSGEGVFYPLRSLRLRADFPHGVSNEIVADSAWVEVEQGTVLMICEKK